jgi:hypothetical protein
LGGYLNWQFFEQESNLLPYNAGSYFGKKRVLSLGAGFVQQKNAVRYLKKSPAAAGDTSYHDLLLLAIDLFFDTYLNKEKGNAISVYAGYFNFDFGKNYVRYNGVMNPVTGTNNAALMGKSNFGNAFPMIASGSTEYLQFGCKFRDGLLKKRGTLMPYFGVQGGQYQALRDNMVMVDIGVNWLISAGNKISLNYQSRPVFEKQPDGSVRDIESARRGMLYLQYQIAF